MNRITVKEVQRVISEKERKFLMRESAEVLAGKPQSAKYTKLLSYNPKYHMSIPIYEFWDKILEWEGRTFKLLYPLSWGTEYTARYRETTNEKENKDGSPSRRS